MSMIEVQAQSQSHTALDASFLPFDPMSRPQIGIDRLPQRRMSTEPRESMNCKSCRKRKVRVSHCDLYYSYGIVVTDAPCYRSSVTDYVLRARPVRSLHVPASTVRFCGFF